MRRRNPPSQSWKTLTHARLRAAQGDHSGAARLLGEMLLAEPDHPQARALLQEIDGKSSAAAPVSDDPPVAPPLACDPSDLKDAFRLALRTDPVPPVRRIRRLQDWLSRVRSGAPSSADPRSAPGERNAG